MRLFSVHTAVIKFSASSSLSFNFLWKKQNKNMFSLQRLTLFVLG